LLLIAPDPEFQIPLSAAHPTPPPLLEMRQPPASLLAGTIKLRHPQEQDLAVERG
jgi:hypothetical protein